MTKIPSTSTLQHFKVHLLVDSWLGSSPRWAPSLCYTKAVPLTFMTHR